MRGRRLRTLRSPDDTECESAARPMIGDLHRFDPCRHGVYAVRDHGGHALTFRSYACSVGLACLLAPSVAAGVECEAQTDVEDLRAAADSVEEAWRAMDSHRVEAAATSATVAVQCASVSLAPDDVATFFRVRGFAEYLAGDIPAAELSLLAARRIQPRYVLPDDLVGQSHPLRKMFVTLVYRATAARSPLPRPAVGVLVIDGIVNATSTPSERPFVFQQLDDDGAVVASSILGAGDRPEYLEYTPPVFVDVVQPDAVGIRSRRTSRTLFVAGLGATAVGVAGMVASAQIERDWKARPECADPEECRGMIRANLGLGLGGIAVTATGAALGVGAVVVGRW